MDIKITPGVLTGRLRAIPSKSHAHRLLICAALADKPTLIKLDGLSDDIRATMRCLNAMGCEISAEAGNGGDSGLLVKPVNMNALPPSVTLDCGESGATARFLLPLAARLYGRFTLTGGGRLPKRPFAPLCDALKNAGCAFDNDKLPLTGTGTPRPGEFLIPGNISSQFISGLLFALPTLDGDSAIRLTTEFESELYADMTAAALEKFQVRVEKTARGFTVPGRQKFISPGGIETEGDWSNAAFFLCMGAMGENKLSAGAMSESAASERTMNANVADAGITVCGLQKETLQCDMEVINILKRFGASITEREAPESSPVNMPLRETNSGSFSVPSGTQYETRRAPLHGTEIDASQIPDLVPVLAAVAAAAQGETRIYNAARLRFKESDRLQTTRDMLAALGGDAEVTADGLLIRGRGKLSGGVTDGAGDHRIVMAATAAACVCENPVIIRGVEAVNKSYPAFFEDYRALGGMADVVRDGE